MTKERVNKLLDAHHIVFSVRYVMETCRNGWDCDAWRVGFKASNGQSFETDYFTGLGLRSNPQPTQTQTQTQTQTPKPPRAADVLENLILDGAALTTSFFDWCSDYGEDEDSIEAWMLYLKCAKAAREFRKVVPGRLQDEIQKIVQGY